MENKNLSPEPRTDQPHLLRFKAANGFQIVLQFKKSEDLIDREKEIESAGLECQRLTGFNPVLDDADMFIDMRNPGFAASFDLEDWL